MLEKWQFNVLFFVGVGGALVMFVGPSVGLDIGENPQAVMGIGAILTYILTQKRSLTKTKKTDETESPEKEVDEDES